MRELAQRVRGFSLLEVIIATAILAMVFAYTSGAIIQGGYFQTKAPLYTHASLLIRSVVLDVEAHYSEEGFSENNVTNETCELPRDTDDAYRCDYDVEKLDIDQGELGEMSAQLLESIMAGVSEEGSMLQAFQVLSFLFIQGDVPISPMCPATPTELLTMCQINTAAIEQNIMGMVQFFPQIITQAAERTRKLRVRIYHPLHDDKDPILEVETYIVVIPEELKALTEDGAIPDPTEGGLLTPTQPSTGTPATGGTPTPAPGGSGGGR